MLQKCEYLTHKAENLHKFFENYLATIKVLPKNTKFEESHCPDQDLAKIFSKGSGKYRSKIGKLVDTFQKSFLELNNQKRNEFLKIFEETNEVSTLFISPSNAVRRAEYPGRTGTTIHALLKELFENTFNNEPFNIRDHYKVYYGAHQNAWCPFCGMEKYTRPEVRKADYDHLLSKTDFPVAAVNLKNLVPMGDHCNRDFKKAIDLFISEDGTVQKVAYPFTSTISPVISLKGSKTSFSSESKRSWKLTITPRTQEVKSWNRLFSIESRFLKEYLEKRKDTQQVSEFESEIWSFISVCKSRRELVEGNEQWTMERMDQELQIQQKNYGENPKRRYTDANYLKLAMYDYLSNHAEDNFKLAMLDSINSDGD